MNEDELLARIRRKVSLPSDSNLVLGIGDDCAIYRPPGAREDLLVTTDMVIEDVHFRRATHPAEAVGHRALARGLSDIAAMGGEPRFFLVSLALSDWADERWRDGFYRGLLKLSRRTGATLAGGDLTRAEKLACDVVVCGTVPRGTALRRDGARPGDRIFVSGALGGSALGLETRRGEAWKRHLKPEPRLDLGRFLREELRATAAMDLSDGLSLDLHRLCLASGVAASVEHAVLRFRGATEEQALSGGEDYELLFTVRPRREVPAKFGAVPLTEIGRIGKGAPGHVKYLGRPLAPRGWDPFRR